MVLGRESYTFSIFTGCLQNYFFSSLHFLNSRPSLSAHPPELTHVFCGDGAFYHPDHETDVLERSFGVFLLVVLVGWEENTLTNLSLKLNFSQVPWFLLRIKSVLVQKIMLLSFLRLSTLLSKAPPSHPNMQRAF